MKDAEKAMRYSAVKHQRIVIGGFRLFRQRGFENVSVGEVMEGRLA
jgi:AcrR family transcriptional regulator